jgi:hypothetical protein
MFVDNVLTKPGQCPSTLPLNHKRKRSKSMKIRIKGIEWDRKKCGIYDKVQLTLYKGTYS